MRPVKRPAGPLGLGLVLTATFVTMGLGIASKAPCADGDWDDLRQYRLLCYTDVVPLLVTEQLTGSRLPFLEACVPVTDQRCDEYPVLTMYVMRLAGWMGGGQYAAFYYANALLLLVAAATTVVATYLVVGGRAMYVALAPTLLVYGTVNWDLPAVALVAVAIVAFAARRDRWAGIALGLGAATKLYPILLVLPLSAERVRERRPDAGIALAWWAVGSWAAVNLPVALAAPGAWFTFFSYNSSRCPDFDSLWSVGMRVAGVDACGHTTLVNLASGAAFIALAAALWSLKVARQPRTPRWAMGFAILVAFLLTNKVYSPQYGLWLLPWFALALPSLRAAIAFGLADVAVFVTRFRWFLDLAAPGEGVPRGAFEIAVVVRALVLVWCLGLWIRREHEALPVLRLGRGVQDLAGSEPA
jgi:uncharacterized membrane protein